MAIFNSLGSNFSWGRALAQLFSSESKVSADNLRQELAATYGGQPILTYKGRQALQAALERCKLPAGARVAINGFTCYVVYQAVQRAGLTPVCVDIATGTLHFTAEQLKAVHTESPLAAVVVQNTFGIPCDIAEIQVFCRDNKLMLIEDLAHSVGSRYEDGREAGSIGDFAMLSFSQDKTLDNVAGGACIDRQSAVVVEQPLMKATFQTRNKRRWYPLLTHTIRSTYPLQIGRVLHKLLKTIHVLAAPMDDVAQTPQALSGQKTALTRWQNRGAEYAHRRRIAQIYKDHLPVTMQFAAKGEPMYVRFPTQHDRAAELRAHLAKNGFYLSDTWYDAPLAPKRYMAQTSYQAGSCPESEKLIGRIVNLPVHQEISEGHALKLCEVINAWQP